MLTAHYSIPLPADYDMDIVVRRVADRAALWDARTGLLFKAFCITEAGGPGPAHNSYAPFYVWAAPQEFARFLTGAEYAGLCAAFGPVPVRTGTILQCTVGTGPTGHLVSETEPLGPVTDLRERARAEAERHRAVLADPAVHSHVVDLDSATMTLTRRTLLREGSEAPRAKSGEQVLRVLHLSQPSPTSTS
ncbi:DUF4865 family protein [Streptomyces pseudogriseolus]|uniref:DUF4865 family protein n=1 Tax=Streptomyces pseudogriseolus TaxID=36817 RepID=UPI003254E1A0